MQGNDTPPAVLRTANGTLAIERPCETCDTLFLSPRNAVAKGQGRFCSRRCASAAATNPRVACACLSCGLTFEKKRSDVARGEGRYCSQRCYRDATTGVERIPLADRFWAKVDKNGPVIRPELGPCWVWTGYIRQDGYGSIQVLDRSELAHRVSYTLNIGPLILWALHKCDNRPCVRPDHLFEGDATTNMRDAMGKGRLILPPQPNPEQLARGDRNGAVRHPERLLRGSQNHRAKLTPEQAVEIHSRYRDGVITQTALAAEYGISQAMCSMICRGGTWHFNPQD